VAWLSNLVGPWGKPGDGPSWAALGVGLLLIAFAALASKRRSVLFEGNEQRFLGASALACAFLSLGYVAYYLRGGPRIIDATAYMWQARALAHGSFGEPMPDASGSFRGRFLLYDEAHGTLHGIFPPGYPLLLSLGVRLGAPMVVGPLLAGALVYAVAHLAREWLQHTSIPREHHAAFVRVAVLAQVTSAAMRYHTADTMSHGLAALLVTLAFAASLRGRRTKKKGAFAVAGLCIGALAATRLASAPPVFLVAAACALKTAPSLGQGFAPTPRMLAPSASRPDARTSTPTPTSTFLSLCLGLAPGLLFLAASQSAVTGSAFSSAQRLYYATSDGPPDCFRYGFGRGVGCLYEHGDFVRARLADGYGVVAALGTTLRRLRAHLTDIQNFELLALVPLFALRVARPAARAALALVALFVLAYAPFYFDGNYPGGGARFFADVLPVEHVLYAAGALAIATRIRMPSSDSATSYTRVALALFGIGLVGFAVHASFAHRALRDRDGGMPMFDGEAIKNQHITKGLLFVDTDDGYLLGHEPTTQPYEEVVVARYHGDAHDRAIFEHFRAPLTYKIERHGPDGGGDRFVPYPPAMPRVDGAVGWRFESEFEWPPLAQEGGYAIPAWASDTCASGGQVLRITPSEGATAHVRIGLPVPEERAFFVAPRFRATGAKGHATLRVQNKNDAKPSDAVFELDDATRTDCVTLPAMKVPLTGKEAIVLIDVSGAPVDLDAVILKP
jgi:hypothetical protein